MNQSALKQGSTLFIEGVPAIITDATISESPIYFESYDTPWRMKKIYSGASRFYANITGLVPLKESKSLSPLKLESVQCQLGKLFVTFKIYGFALGSEGLTLHLYTETTLDALVESKAFPSLSLRPA